ncbi:MAG TPA: nucleoside kinase, partial [Spirochaetia bacterium]|nr:nucleoside kinase [Spirochaetia bacterium]
MNTVHVQLPDRTLNVPAEMTLRELCKDYDTAPDNPVVAAVVNNEVLDLSRRVRIRANVQPVYLASDAGVRCYRESLCFLLALAVQRVCPGRRIIIGHSLGDSYYHYFDDSTPVEDETLQEVAAEMRRLVDEELPIHRRFISYEDAVGHFTKNGMTETAALLDHRNDSRITVHECTGFIDISHGPLVPHTGVLRYFDLKPLEPGFVLRFPSRREPTELHEYRHSNQLFSIYQEYKEWARILGITSVGRLNQKVVDQSVGEFIRVNEALHEKKIADIGTKIAERRSTVRVVLIAGPSSSGKTTFTKRLALQLSAQGMQPHLVSVDD